MYGDDVCCSVVFGTLVGVFVFSVMWSELLMTSAISCPLWSSVYECQRVECAFTSPVRTECGMFQTTQPTSGGAVTVDSNCCANCVEPPRPHQWGPDLKSIQQFLCHNSVYCPCCLHPKIARIFQSSPTTLCLRNLIISVQTSSDGWS